MRITTIEGSKRPSYDDEFPNEFIVTVGLSGDTGKQDLRLSMGAISRVFEVIREDLIATAAKNAAMVTAAVDEAIHGPLLADKSTVTLPF